MRRKPYRVTCTSDVFVILHYHNLNNISDLNRGSKQSEAKPFRGFAFDYFRSHGLEVPSVVVVVVVVDGAVGTVIYGFGVGV